jgi:hypothetical protein
MLKRAIESRARWLGAMLLCLTVIVRAQEAAPAASLTPPTPEQLAAPGLVIGTICPIRRKTSAFFDWRTVCTSARANG